MPAVISIVGKSNSGKTTLIEKLLPRLKQRGYLVGVVKHAHHGFDMDRQGKDSYRHRHAGADTVMIASPGQIALIKNAASETMDDLIPYFEDVDLLITEGFKRGNAPKIEIFRSEEHRQPACLEDVHLVAVVADAPVDTPVPQFALNDVAALTDFIISGWLATPSKS